jgi:hypothetical protein
MDLGQSLGDCPSRISRILLSCSGDTGRVSFRPGGQKTDRSHFENIFDPSLNKRSVEQGSDQDADEERGNDVNRDLPFDVR